MQAFSYFSGLSSSSLKSGSPFRISFFVGAQDCKTIHQSMVQSLRRH
jgi:hypothetical protein